MIFCHRLALVVWIVFSAAAQAEEQRPNVILFIADDVSWNDYGCYGNPMARTPHIDQLAKNGIRFTNAILAASSCSPSRASVITGRYPHNTGKAAELHLPIAHHLPWFPQVLRKAGYFTALVGKNHMKREKPNPGSIGQPQVFDLVDNGQLKDNHGAEGKWVQTLKNCPREKPFFFWFAAMDAHRDWDADREWKAEYGPMHEASAVVVPPYLVDNLETRKDLASYYNEVTRFDFYIGQVVKALKDEGLFNNTLILVMADNGRPFPRAKTRLHDSGMKTALVAHWPDGMKSRGKTAAGLVSAIDIAPTILEVAGVEVPGEFQGISFRGVLDNHEKVIRNFAFSEHNWHDYEAHGRSIRDNDGHLYIKNERPYLPWQGPADSVKSPSHQSLLEKKKVGDLTAAQKDVFLSPRARFELYDTSEDPWQLKNLAGDSAYQKIESKLKGNLEAWTRETMDTVPRQISQDSFDRETGNALPRKKYRFVTPGEEKQAAKTNRPGPR